MNSKNTEKWRRRPLEMSSWRKPPIQTSLDNRPRGSRQYGYNNMRNKEVHLSLTKVKEMLELGEEDILLKLVNPHFGYENYLEVDRMGKDLVLAFTELLAKALKCGSMRTQSARLLIPLPSSIFFKKHVYEHVNLLMPDGQYNLKLIREVIDICRVVMEVNPAQRIEIEPMKERIELLIRLKINEPELIKEFNSKLTLYEEAVKRREIREERRASRKVADDFREPPNDITEMSIVPDLQDIISDERVFLRKNITNGAYRNVEHYLDVQFRLLREDFMTPLQEGVKTLRTLVNDEAQRQGRHNHELVLNEAFMAKLRKIDSVNVYLKVQMRSNEMTRNGVAYEMELLGNRGTNLERSKKLMFGSLVCLSRDFFRSECLVGTVCERDKLKNKSRINLKFDSKNELNAENAPRIGETYLMLETSAYFESYKHVLNALLAFHNDGEENFPFKENLVYCNNQNIPPPHFLRYAYIDFRPLVDKEKTIKTNMRTGLTEYEFSDSVKYAEKCFSRDMTTWPTAEQLGFDQSQYDALKLALNTRLALIQGPPGTGKTFIGVKLVQLLLHNHHLWSNREGLTKHKTPILMICYTNHALDQFLELIVKECRLEKGVVRVGGQCQSESLQPFVLKNIKQNRLGIRSRVSGDIIFRMTEASKAIRRIEDEIKSIVDSIRKSYDCVVGLDQLNSFCTDQRLELFTSQHNSSSHTTNVDLLRWLGLVDFVDEELEEEMKRAMAVVDEEEKNTNIDVVGEVREENETEDEEEKQRILDDDDDENEIEFQRKLDEDYDWKFYRSEEEDYNSLSKCNYIEYADFLDSKLIDKLCQSMGGWRQSTKKKYDWVQQRLAFISRFSHRTLKPNLPHNCWEMEMSERYKLYNLWVQEFRIRKQEDLEELYTRYNRSATALQEMKMQEDRFLMQDALIVAMTTTGSARYHAILRDLRPKIVIVEEAAEVFEAHIVSSLTKYCEHLVLIGDHVQLRPNPTVYKLAKEYEIDVSLFERLLKNDARKEMLASQHRMRPEISSLMKHFYEHPIRDDASVGEYPAVRGLKTNLFFISHTSPEKSNGEEKSKTNPYEAVYLAKFCRYLVKQGYAESQITILSMYLGQLMEIRRLVRNEMKLTGVKISTVDNYQGEENDIILLSLVRSNSAQKIGFLATSNRVCVALSRARHGLFAIGNFEMLGKASEKWRQIIESLGERVGDGMSLTCVKHPQHDLTLRLPDDFDRRPEGGCQLPCDFRLKCGHVCKLLCHSYDPMHENYECPSVCDKVISKCGHLCRQQCSHEEGCEEECGEMVDKVIRECSHAVRVRCDYVPKIRDCRRQCENILLQCGHQCMYECGQRPCRPCKFELEVDSVCKHPGKIKVKCSEPTWSYRAVCGEKCGKVLECGHLCPGKCGECLAGLIHVGCRAECGRLLICGHKCNVNCANQCLPCTKECQNRCEHSKCYGECGELCVPCNEACGYRCAHKSCTRRCHEICDREPCNEPCGKKLKCGHECIGFCGEPCPKLCRLCDQEEVCEIFFGNEEEADARFVLLDDCGHLIESSGMDQWMESRYNTSDQNTIQLPECPKCKTVIRRNLRYSNYVKRQLNAIEQVKLRSIGDLFIIEATKENLFKSISSKDSHQQFSYEMKSAISIKNTISMSELKSAENKWNLLVKWKDLEAKVVKELKCNQVYFAHLTYELRKLAPFFTSPSYKINFFRSEQEIKEINLELSRISSLIKYYQIKLKVEKNEYEVEKKNEIEQILAELEQCLLERYDKVEAELEEKLASLRKMVQVELSEEEKVMIREAIGLKQGHWFKCPNGHIYCIGECGGAMQVGKCPDCAEAIGGQSHALLNTNSVASEMDGATLSAWDHDAILMGNVQIR